MNEIVLRADTHRTVQRSVKVLDVHRIFNRLARTLVGRLAVLETPLDTPTKKQHATGIGEMAMHPVLL